MGLTWASPAFCRSPWMPPLVHCSADLEDAIRGRVPGPKQGSWEELRSHFAFLHGQVRALTAAAAKGAALPSAQAAECTGVVGSSAASVDWP